MNNVIILPKEYSQFEATHNCGNWKMKNARPQMNELRKLIDNQIGEIIQKPSFPFKPLPFESQIGDFGVVIQDYENEWTGWIGFEYFIKGNFGSDYVNAFVFKMEQKPQHHYWSAGSSRAGCTFKPGSFFVFMYQWQVSEDKLIAMGFPTRGLMDLWVYNNWYASPYWKNQPRYTGE